MAKNHKDRMAVRVLPIRDCTVFAEVPRSSFNATAGFESPTIVVYGSYPLAELDTHPPPAKAGVLKPCEDVDCAFVGNDVGGLMQQAQTICPMNGAFSLHIAFCFLVWNIK